MAYSELIKDYARIREYMREFFVYGFKSREEFDQKSARSYDNERRRIASWLGDNMTFQQDASGKNMFISVDCRHVPHNPFHRSWKAASFTKNDISLHFILLDILADNRARLFTEILDSIDRDYLPAFSSVELLDESTVRKKLKEYVDLGLIAAEKQGNRLAYRLPENDFDLEAWQDALLFFSEENPLGVIGSYLLDKYRNTPGIFSFKHHYLLFSLDSGIIADLLSALHEHRVVELEFFPQNGLGPRVVSALPVKLFVSTQGGRQYLAGFDTRTKKLFFYRLDGIRKVKALDVEPDFAFYEAILAEARQHLWGVATGARRIEHVDMTLRIAPAERHIARRLEREKRCGTVEQLDETTWRFSADVYDAQELLPWFRTFIGRIEGLSCSNRIVERRFWSDYALMVAMYEGDGNAV